MEIAEETIKNLLSQVSTIVSKYDEIAVANGENFNVFQILNLSSAEVRLHSKLLAELLNPKGSHNLGDVFLKLFIQRLNNSPFIGEPLKLSELENSLIEVEKYTGNIDKQNDTGGNIDIFIHLPGQSDLVIENKIFAGDQESQLRRYHNFNKTKKPVLVYLTLDGKEADEFTTKNSQYNENKIEPVLFSYQSDVKEWLEDCRKEATNLPVVRETITQYINLIKNLTGQSMNNNMKNDVVKAISESGAKVKGAFEIGTALSDVKKLLLKKFAEEVILKVKKAKPSVSADLSNNFGEKWNGISFSLQTISSTNVYFSFLKDYKDVYLEIGNKQNYWQDKIKKVELKNIEYYRNALVNISKGWGIIENTVNAWNGDWVCRYRKMDVWINDGSLWYDIAENKFDDKAEKVAQDILVLLESTEKKQF